MAVKPNQQITIKRINKSAAWSNQHVICKYVLLSQNYVQMKVYGTFLTQLNKSNLCRIFFLSSIRKNWLKNYIPILSCQLRSLNLRYLYIFFLKEWTISILKLLITRMQQKRRFLFMKLKGDDINSSHVRYIKHWWGGMVMKKDRKFFLASSFQAFFNLYHSYFSLG
jgi:hypothetical protein